MTIDVDQRLALAGGPPAIDRPLPPDTTIGDEEKAAVERVFERGSLSGFYGSWGDEFLGGVEVKAFEAEWAEKFEVPHVVSVNSATSGLFAALGAFGISPGDEVIVPPYTMSATVMAPLIYGAIPVFADIDPETFCLDVSSVRAALTPRTKAIIVVNLFGQAGPVAALMALAAEHGIKVIEDNAQGPLATEHGRYAGTIADIGVFSLNYHKHIHAGEGGMCATRDPELALRLQAIRNHAENIVEHAPIADPVNMIGYNYRMTEMSAAVGRSQLAKIEREVSRRQHLAERLSEGIAGLEGLTPPMVRDGCRHVYYVWGAKVDADVLGVTREQFSAALAAEGVPHFTGYVRPLYMLPAFQRRIAIGRDGWPFTLTNRTYEKGLCPIAERMHEREMLCYETCAYRLDDAMIASLVGAIRKVHGQRHLIGRD